MGEALEDAVHCTLEQRWCRSNTKWQPGVLEQPLMGVNGGQFLCILRYRDLLVCMSKVQLGESFSVGQRGKNILNAWQGVGVGLGNCIHG